MNSQFLCQTPSLFSEQLFSLCASAERLLSMRVFLFFDLLLSWFQVCGWGMEYQGWKSHSPLDIICTFVPSCLHFLLKIWSICNFQQTQVMTQFSRYRSKNPAMAILIENWIEGIRVINNTRDGSSQVRITDWHFFV